MHILLPVDFSAVTDSVLDYALRLIENQASSCLTLLHVIEPPSPLFAWDTVLPVEPLDLGPATDRLQSFADRLRTTFPELAIQIQVEVGPGSWVIREFLDNHSVDEIVIGSHGHGALYDWIVGSVAASILKRAICPVHIIPAWKSNLSLHEGDGILAAVDLSEMSDDVVAAAVRLGAKTGEEVVVVYAEELDTAFTAAASPADDLLKFKEGRGAVLQTALQNLINQVTNSNSYKDISIVGEVRAGPPSDVMLQEIAYMNPSILVMGAHRKGVVHDLILGSFSRRLLKNLSIPALIIPASSDGKSRNPTESEGDPCGLLQ